MTQVEDMAWPAAGAAQHIARGIRGHGERREARRGIEIALDPVFGADGGPGGVERLSTLTTSAPAAARSGVSAGLPVAK